MDNFIDNNEVYQMFAEGKICLRCNHVQHCGLSCYTDDDSCDCFECECAQCKAKSIEF
jgi:hypothetical protein